MWSKIRDAARLCFAQGETMEPTLRNLALQNLPYCPHEVFCCWYHATKPIYLKIQIPMIQLLDHLTLQDFSQRFEIDHHPGSWIWFALHCYFERKIVPMVVRIAALPVER